jgi:thiamine biosynthesis lipoprotein
MLRLFAILFSVLLLACTEQPQQPQATHLTGKTMGTTYNVKYFPVDVALPAQEVQTQINGRLLQVNALMSTWDPNSELSRFNQSEAGVPLALSEETLLVLAEAMRLAELSGGALDVTIGPLVNLWGFGPHQRPDTIPTAAQISQAKLSMGLDKLVLDGNALSKTVDELYLDLSPIAKGYGVDVVAEYLESIGVTNYLVEIGGEMRVAGQKADGTQWLIAIEKPVDTQRAIQQVVSIGNNAIATSGDYRNYYEEDGVRYSHLLDPATGQPIGHKLVSASVVHPSSMTADGLATALIVMGTQRAQALAEDQNLAVLLITKDGDEFVEYRSPAFDKIVTLVPVQ